jgi:hypothetical protein
MNNPTYYYYTYPAVYFVQLNEGNLCGTCNEDCKVRSRSAVLCSKCKLWYHANCEGLKINEMKILAEQFSQDYICKTDCANLNGHFDYDSSISRLKSSPSATKLEKILLRNHPLTSGSKVFELYINGKKEDEISKNILSSVGKNISLNIYMKTK